MLVMTMMLMAAVVGIIGAMAQCPTTTIIITCNHHSRATTLTHFIQPALQQQVLLLPLSLLFYLLPQHLVNFSPAVTFDPISSIVLLCGSFLQFFTWDSIIICLGCYE